MPKFRVAWSGIDDNVLQSTLFHGLSKNYINANPQNSPEED
jgi:hypothetical protein